MKIYFLYHFLFATFSCIPNSCCSSLSVKSACVILMMLATNIIAKNNANVNPQDIDIFHTRNTDMKNPTMLVSIKPAER